MKKDTVRIVLLTVPFVVFSTFAVWQHGYWAIFEAAMVDTSSLQLFFDLCVSLTLVMTLVRRDARTRGLTAWPWLVATPLLGSIAPLFYLLYRDLVATPAEPTSA